MDIIPLLLCIILACHISGQEDLTVPATLKAVQVLMRHGDREADTIEGVGSSGQLTKTGKAEMYRLGQFLRERYKTLVKPVFDGNEVSFISSDTDRTIDSALLLAYGFYEPDSPAARGSKNTLFNHSLFTPIPIRSIPEELDKYLHCTRSCPKFDMLSDESLTKLVNELFARNAAFMQKFVEETGDQLSFNRSISAFARSGPLIVFQENVQYNISHGLPVPEWAKEVVTNEELLGFQLAGNTGYVSTPQTQMLYNGPFLKLLLDNFEGENEKITFFMGHDRNMYTLMYTLGLWDSSVNVLPPTGSALIVELHEKKLSNADELLVEFWYRNNTAYPPQLLHVPKCESPCSLKEFKDKFNDILPVDYDLQCEIK